MKKSLLALAAGVALTAASADAATVYFENTAGWATVNAYTFNTADGDHGAWPGKALTSEDFAGHTLYKTETADAKVIFNGDGKQTGNLEVEDNAVYNASSNEPIAYIIDGVWKDAAEDQYAAMYVVGDMSGWVADKTYKMSTEDGVTYIWTGDIESGKEFKFYGGAWGTRELSGAGSNLANGTYNLFYDSSNMTLKTGGKVTFTLVQSDNFASATLTIAGQEEGGGDDPVVYETLYLIGEPDGGWAANKGIEMTKGDKNIFSWTGELKANCHFAFASKLGANADDWDTMNANRFGAATDAQVIEIGNNTLVKGSNAYKTSDAANYNFEVDMNTMTLKVSKLTAVETIEAASGEAVYFNLQGVRVANPENGLYIRVQNGKAVKVVK